MDFERLFIAIVILTSITLQLAAINNNITRRADEIVKNQQKECICTTKE